MQKKRSALIVGLLGLTLQLGAEVGDGQYEGGPLVMTPTFLSDANGSYGVDQLPDVKPRNGSRIKGPTTPLIEHLWEIAKDDCERNIVSNELGTYFGAGSRYGPRVYTRDIAFAGIFGANDLYPNEMLQSLKITRDLRLELGYKVSRPHVIDEIQAPWEVIAEVDKEIMAKYKTNCYTRRTDDIIWMWAAEDLFLKHPKLADWNWFYETGRRCFEELYAPWYDKTDGLYLGQPTFQDLTHTSYPDGSSIADCVLIKSASTNALYYKGLLAMARAAEKIGQSDKVVKQWRERAASLKLAFRRHLIMPDGEVCYYIDRHGRMLPNQHNLGTGLAVILGVLEGEAAVKAYAHYPSSDKGVALIHPFLADNMGSHNAASWPFCSTIFLWGKEIAEGRSYQDYNTALLARSIGTKMQPKKNKKGKKSSGQGDSEAHWNSGFGSFHEKTSLPSGLIGGSGHQLWSSAAFLNVFLRHGQVEIE
jgi:hypothetical protein